MFFSRKVYIVFIFIWIGICWVFLYSKKESNTLHENALVNIPKNLESSDYWGSLSDQIIYERSLSKKNSQDCADIKDYHLQEECQLKIATYNAAKQEKLEICWDLKNENTKNSCIWDVARKLAKKKNQPDICQNITDASQQFECIADVRSNERQDQMVEENGLSRMNYKNQAIQQRDLQFCMQDNHYDEDCVTDVIKNILEQDDDTKWCESLAETDPRNYLSCRDMWLQMNKSNRMHDLIKQTIIDGNDTACASDLSLQDRCILAYKKIQKILTSY